MFKFVYFQGWEIASNSVQQTHFTVLSLTPDASYVFVVRARNSHGMGYPSDMSVPVRTKSKHIVFKI